MTDITTLTEQEIHECAVSLSKCMEDYALVAAHLADTKKALDTLKLIKLASGEIDGKNAELREARAMELLQSQYAALQHAEERERDYRLKLDLARLDWERVKLILRLAEVLKA